MSLQPGQRIVIVGDLHGQLPDLLLIFRTHGWPSDENLYCFNGDFVDRGAAGGAAGWNGRPPCLTTPLHPPAWRLPRAQAAPMHPGAPPQQLGGVPWPQQPASGRPKVEGFSAVPSPPGVELVLLLFAWQQCLPHAVFLNRGNHEDSAVNCTCVQSS